MFISIIQPKIAPLRPRLRPPTQRTMRRTNLIRTRTMNINMRRLIGLLHVRTRLLDTLTPIKLTTTNHLNLSRSSQGTISRRRSIEPTNKTTISQRLINRPPIINVRIFMISRPRILNILNHIRLMIRAILRPNRPLLIIATDRRLNSSNIRATFIHRRNKIRHLRLITRRQRR